ncbi:MAG: cytochrome c [Thermomicrobiales bacterium]
MPQFGRQITDRPIRRRMNRSLLHALSTIGLLVTIMIVLSACAGVNDSGSHPDFIETQAAGQPAEEDGHGDEDGTPEPGSPEPGTPEPGGEATEGAGGDGGEDLAAVGQELAGSNGCTGCHSIDGSVIVGPSWQGLYGSEVTLTDGSTVTGDDSYIAESIRDPSAKIHDGFQDIMPKIYAEWTEEQVNAIIAYIQTLE